MLGIPRQALDKRGSLDDNGFRMVMAHAGIGKPIPEPFGGVGRTLAGGPLPGKVP